MLHKLEIPGAWGRRRIALCLAICLPLAGGAWLVQPSVGVALTVGAACGAALVAITRLRERRELAAAVGAGLAGALAAIIVGVTAPVAVESIAVSPSVLCLVGGLGIAAVRARGSERARWTQLGLVVGLVGAGATLTVWAIVTVDPAGAPLGEHTAPAVEIIGAGVPSGAVLGGTAVLLARSFAANEQAGRRPARVGWIVGFATYCLVVFLSDHGSVAVGGRLFEPALLVAASAFGALLALGSLGMSAARDAELTRLRAPRPVTPVERAGICLALMGGVLAPVALAYERPLLFSPTGPLIATAVGGLELPEAGVDERWHAQVLATGVLIGAAVLVVGITLWLLARSRPWREVRLVTAGMASVGASGLLLLPWSMADDLRWGVAGAAQLAAVATFAFAGSPRRGALLLLGWLTAAQVGYCLAAVLAS